MSLVENDNKQKQEPNDEIDRFSRFMFGNSKHRETNKKGENNSQEIARTKRAIIFRLAGRNRTDDWFFGFTRKEPATSTHTNQNQIEDLLNNVDFELLMETIDMFFTTYKQYKPLFKEITPLMHQFIKKFKSNKDV